MDSHALGLAVALDERGLRPSTKVRLHLVAEVSAIGPGIERARPPLSVVLAVDVSGSMKGEPLEHVVKSIARLVALLEPTDRVGVVAFSDSASEVAPLLPATAETRRLIASRAQRLDANGATNVEAGLARAAVMMPARGPHERQVILLLSDGAPNRGRCTASDLGALAKSLRPEIGVSTLGYGIEHNEDVLRAISDAGAGRYHFIADPSVCEIEFAQAIGTQGDVVAEAIELALIPEPGIELARFLGSTEVRFGANGLRAAVPDLLDGSKHLVVAEVDATPPREPGPWTALRASLTYRRAGEREARTLEASLVVEVGAGAQTVVPEVRAHVLRARADEIRAKARALADRGQFEGAAAVLRQLIKTVQAEPWFVFNDGSPIAETIEQLLDEATAMERKPSAENYRTFRKTQFGTVLASQQGSPTSTPMSQMAMSTAAGVLPAARLVVMTGDDAGRQIRLELPKAIIGRTVAADIVIKDANVSRQQAMIVAQGGRYRIMDLGSTNPTLHNGRPIDKPVMLAAGDLLRVGDVELRYEEEGRSTSG